MKKYHEIITKEKHVEETINAKKLQGARVLSHTGKLVGKVSQIRIDASKKEIEGVIVTRGMFKRPLYIGREYIKQISPQSFILQIYPSVLLVGRKVLTAEGEKIGRVKKVVRDNHANTIKEIQVNSLMRKNFIIHMSDIKLLGESIILKAHYRTPKKYFWPKN